MRSVAITGANSGIGKELARQIGSRPGVERVVLACRDRGRAESARTELARATGRSIFEIVEIDTADLSSIPPAVDALAGPIDALVMNAGGVGGPRPAAQTATGATEIFAANVLGHAALLDVLIRRRLLRRVAILTGSEAARGIPKLMIKRPAFARTSENELVAAIDGTIFGKGRFDASVAYAQTKYIGALWIGAMARRHPELRLATVSPGGTSGTAIAEGMPLAQRLAFKYLLMGKIGSRLGLAHPPAEGAARLARAVFDPAYGSGIFYASGPRTLTGPVVDQATIFADLADREYQDNADAAVRRFLERGRPA